MYFQKVCINTESLIKDMLIGPRLQLLKKQFTANLPCQYCQGMTDQLKKNGISKVSYFKLLTDFILRNI